MVRTYGFRLRARGRDSNRIRVKVRIMYCTRPKALRPDSGSELGLAQQKCSVLRLCLRLWLDNS